MTEPNTDPLNAALHEALLATLLGSHTVPNATWDSQGNPVVGIITVPSAFQSRIQARAYKGDFDDIINRAVAALTPEHLAGALADKLVEHMLVGLEPVDGGYNRPKQPGWLAHKAKEIAVEAATTAMMADEGFLETLRERIGMEVDRNRVGISVSLSDPEK